MTSPTDLDAARPAPPESRADDARTWLRQGAETRLRELEAESGRTLTGHGQDCERPRAAGFDEHWLKPMGLTTLVALLDRCPSATSPRQESAEVAP